MSIKIHSKELLTVAQSAAAALPDRAIAAIQECLRITPAFIEGISYQHGVRIPLNTATGEGDFCVPAKDLISVLNLIAGDVTIDKSGISWETGSLTLPIEDGKDYLESSFEQGTIPFSPMLVEAIIAVRPYLSHDELNTFSSAYTDFAAGYVYGGTTKSLRREHIAKGDWPDKIPITRSSIPMIQKWAKGEGWIMSVGMSTLFFSRNNERFFITMPTFTAPKFESPFEKFDEPLFGTFKTAPVPKLVMQVVKGMAAVLGSNVLAHFIPSGSGFEIVCTSDDTGKRMTQRLPGDFPTDIHFNASMLAGALEGADEWLLLDRKNPALIKGPTFECQVMPTWFN